MVSDFKSHLIPHKGNDHRPIILRTPTIRLLLALTVFIEILFLLQAFRLALPLGEYLSAVMESVMVAETNIYRSEASIPTLSVNSLLEEAARRKAQDMAEKEYFAHTGPDGTLPWKWLRDAGYYYLAAGENLAVNFIDSKDVTEAWMNSPSHRANILNAGFTEIGIGTAVGIYKGKEATYVVQFFGRPYVAPPPPLPPVALAAVEPPLAPSEGNVSGVSTVSASDEEESSVEPTLAAADPVDVVEEGVEEETSSSDPVIILGSETEIRGGEIAAPEPGFLSTLITNPRRATGSALAFVISLLFIVMLLSTILWRKEKKEHHHDLIANGLAVVAITLSFLIVNEFLSVKDLLIQ